MAKKLVILISGRGSNMLSIVDAIEKGRIKANIECVISNRKDAEGIASAQKRGLATQIVEQDAYPDKAAFEQALREAVEAHKPDLILLAGFMFILSPAFVQNFANQIINIHPSLLPDYKGLHTHLRVLEDKKEYHGCSVHLVTEELDAGALLGQAKVPVLADDTVETLAARVLKEEHKLYPKCVAALCE